MRVSKDGDLNTINDLMRVFSYFFYDDLNKFAQVNEFAKFYLQQGSKMGMDPLRYLIDQDFIPSLESWD